MKDTKKGDLVFFCHHGKPIERLTEPYRNRIKFILEYKSEEDQALRLHWFRPVAGAVIPKDLMDNINDYGYISYNFREKYAKKISALIAKYLPGCPWDSKRGSILPK